MIQTRPEDRCAKLLLNHIRCLQASIATSYIGAPSHHADTETKTRWVSVDSREIPPRRKVRAVVHWGEFLREARERGTRKEKLIAKLRESKMGEKEVFGYGNPLGVRYRLIAG